MATLMEMLDRVERRLDEIEAQKSAGREPSRALMPGAQPSLVEHVAKGGAIDGSDGVTVAEPRFKAAGRGTGLLDVYTKALSESTAGGGGVLVPVEIAAEILRLVRARSAIMSMPGTRVVEVAKELDVNSITTGLSASYALENAHAVYSEMVFGQAALLKPKELVAFTATSNRLLKDTARGLAPGEAVEETIRAELAEVIALRADLAFIQGSGTDPEPRGIRNIAGLTAAPNLGANGATPTFDNLKDTVANLRAANARFQAPGWVFNPRLLSTLEKVKDSTGRYLVDSGMLTYDRAGTGGELLGYPFRTTTQIPTNVTTGTSTDTTYVIFSSDWEEAWIGEGQELEVESSREASYTADGGTSHVHSFQARQTVFRAVTSNDIALRRPAFFTVLTGVRP